MQTLRVVPEPPAAPAEPKLSFRGVRKSYVQRSGAVIDAIDDVRLDVGDGEFVCIVGPSGCGKSTVLNLVAGLERPDRGDVMVDGHRVREPGPDRAMLFQEPSLFPWMSVMRNVEFALELGGMPKAERRAVASRWLDKVHLSRFADAQPHELSPGMRQRAALARALACQPQVLLADEPFGALDAQAREMLQRELQSVWLETRNTFLFVTHNVREAVFLADRVVLMSARPGRLLTEHRISTARPRDLGDALLAKVVDDIHEQLLGEVDRVVATETDAGSDLA
ncbi:MAG: ABC transporter ATP-binding protein [Actinomycetota bacterium]|jgi:NitT/TauT family transport system ATP-binding protein